jgi:hypothetical protein
MATWHIYMPRSRLDSWDTIASRGGRLQNPSSCAPLWTMDPKSGVVVGTLAGSDVAARTTLLGDVSSEPAKTIGSGRVAILFLDVTFENLRDVPKEVEHRVKSSFDLPPEVLFPDATTETGARTEVSRKKPVVVGSAGWATRGIPTPPPALPRDGRAVAAGGRPQPALRLRLVRLPGLHRRRPHPAPVGEPPAPRGRVAPDPIGRGLRRVTRKLGSPCLARVRDAPFPHTGAGLVASFSRG